MIKKGKTVINLLLLSFLVSCIPAERIEEMAIISARGLDVLEDDELETTLLTFQFEAQSDTLTKIVTGRGKTLKGAMNNADLESTFPLTPGKLEIELYGMEAAKKGVLPSLDTLQRDARVSNTMYLAVSNTTAKEILTMPEENISMNVGQFIHGLIENNATDHNFPKTSLQDFLRVYYDIGQDNVLPIIELQGEDIPKVTKIGLFRGDKLVDELSIQEATFLNLIFRTVKEKMLELSLPLEPFKKHLEKREHRNQERILHTTFLIEKGKSKTTLVDKERLVFETEVNLELRLVEQFEGILIKDGHIVKLLEEEVKKKLTGDFERLLAKTQEVEADPFGYGKIYRIKQKDGKLSRKEWRKKYPEIDVKFKVKPKIIRRGTTE